MNCQHRNKIKPGVSCPVSVTVVLTRGQHKCSIMSFEPLLVLGSKRNTHNIQGYSKLISSINNYTAGTQAKRLIR